MTHTGFPHSEIAGSKDVCSSPTLIAAYHVLHSLPVPRHPPNALSSLTEKLFCFTDRQIVPSSFRSQLITEQYLFFSEVDIRPRWFSRESRTQRYPRRITLLFPIVKDQADNRPHWVAARATSVDNRLFVTTGPATGCEKSSKKDHCVHHTAAHYDNGNYPFRSERNTLTMWSVSGSNR